MQYRTEIIRVEGSTLRIRATPADPNTLPGQYDVTRKGIEFEIKQAWGRCARISKHAYSLRAALESEARAFGNSL
jgi:hypothetical protein